MKRSLTALILALWLALASSCAGPREPAPLLPSSLYYLDGEGAQAQVWKLEREAGAPAQVTDQPGGIAGFAVSRADGSLAFISAGKLYLWQAGQPAPRLLADPAQISPPPEYEFAPAAAAPVFSPDGQILAYDLYGIRLYNLENGETEFLLPSPGALLGETYIFAKEYYSPGPWSPDGRQMLVVMGYYEGDTLAIYQPGAEFPIRRLWSSFAVCCTYSWSADSRSLLVGNPYYTTLSPGLWEYDAAGGRETILLEPIQEPGVWNFAGWPFRSLSGGLRYFKGSVDSIQDLVENGQPITYRLVEGDPREGPPQELRPEDLRICEALWAGDGSLALIVQPAEDGRELVLVRADGSPLQTLGTGSALRQLAWGP